MTLVSRLADRPSKAFGPTEKYAKQTYESMSNLNVNLEMVALQIAQMPVREQKKFFRLVINYIDITSNNTTPTMRDVVELCNRLIDVVNDYYEEQEQLQLAFEGM